MIMIQFSWIKNNEFGSVKEKRLLMYVQSKSKDEDCCITSYSVNMFKNKKKWILGNSGGQQQTDNNIVTKIASSWMA